MPLTPARSRADWVWPFFLAVGASSALSGAVSGQAADSLRGLLDPGRGMIVAGVGQAFWLLFLFSPLMDMAGSRRAWALSALAGSLLLAGAALLLPDLRGLLFMGANAMAILAALAARGLLASGVDSRKAWAAAGATQRLSALGAALAGALLGEAAGTALRPEPLFVLAAAAGAWLAAAFLLRGWKEGAGPKIPAVHALGWGAAVVAIIVLSEAPLLVRLLASPPGPSSSLWPFASGAFGCFFALGAALAAGTDRPVVQGWLAFFTDGVWWKELCHYGLFLAPSALALALGEGWAWSGWAKAAWAFLAAAAAGPMSLKWGRPAVRKGAKILSASALTLVSFQSLGLPLPASLAALAAYAAAGLAGGALLLDLTAKACRTKDHAAGILGVGTALAMAGSTLAVMVAGWLASSAAQGGGQDQGLTGWMMPALGLAAFVPAVFGPAEGCWLPDPDGSSRDSAAGWRA